MTALFGVLSVMFLPRTTNTVSITSPTIRYWVPLIVSFLLLFGSRTVAAQGAQPATGGRPQPILQVSHGVFRSDVDNKVRVEVYYQVYNFGLEFMKSGEDFIARYSIRLQMDGDKEAVSLDTLIERSILVKRKEQTTSRFDFRTSQINLEFNPGKYKARLTLIDRASQQERIREFQVTADLGDRRYPALSSIELIQASEELSESDTTIFRKGNLSLVPSVIAAFGGSDSSRISYYMEVYPARERTPGDTQHMVIETRLRHDARGLIYRDTTHLDVVDQTIRQLRSISLKDLPPGGYDMEVYLRGRRMVEIGRKTQRVVVLWDQQQQIKNDWRTIIQQLSYIAVGADLRALKAAKTLEERTAAFDQFWLQLDPTVGTAENEEKREFYRRLNQANVRFTSGRREGWKSDRGRIFVQVGEPDKIDDVYFSPSEQPYQVWHYYLRGEYLRFLFVDEDRDGDYRLYPPYDGKGMRPDF